MTRFKLLCATVSTLLTVSSCSNTTITNDNPFFSKWDTPYQIPPFEEIKPEHFIPAFEEGIELQKSEIQQIIDNKETPNFENVILAYDNSGEFLFRVSRVFSNICSAQLTDTLKQLQSIVSPMNVKHSNDIILNEELFKKIKKVYDTREILGFDEQKMRLTEVVYKNFTSGGSLLSNEKKERLRSINEELSKSSLDFGNNLMKEMSEFVLVVDNTADLEGLSQNLIDAASAEADKRGEEGKWIFTLDKPSMIPFLQSSTKRELREKLYKGYLNRCTYDNATNNNALINQMVNLRLERANILDFATHADAVLDRGMAKRPELAYDLLDELWAPALDRANSEMQEMIAIKKKESGDASFESWDWWYYAEKLRKAKYDLDESMLSPYFSLETTREGVFMVCNKLFGITFKEIKDAPKYNTECQTYEVIDNNGTPLGALIMDFHPRTGKGVGAWCTSFKGQKYVDGKREMPITSIVCNFTPPTKDAPSLLNLDEVETFFHEFGHALHTLFSDLQYSGIRGVSRDFVELPSQIMENWSMDPQVLKLYAKHYKTGETIPDELITKIKNSALFNQGFMTVEYVGASYLDLDYHTIKENATINAQEFEDNSLAGRGILAQIAPRYRSNYFKHIFAGGYSAGYYAYIWAEVLDADAYEAFVESGDIFNKEIATRFRDCILSQGGSKDEALMYQDFRGKEPSKTPLLKKRGLI